MSCACADLRHGEAEHILFEMEGPLGKVERLLRGHQASGDWRAQCRHFLKTLSIALEALAEADEARSKAWKLLRTERTE